MSLKYMLAALILFSAPVFAAGTCEGKADAHQSFCDGKARGECKVHSGVCEWKEAVTMTMVTTAEKCTALAGKEAHESFCASNTKQTCAAHGSVCTWK